MLYKLATLTRLTIQGGLGMPDFYKYFIATHLVTAHWWLVPNLSNSSRMLEAAILNSLEALQHLLFSGIRAPYTLTPPLM